MPPVADVVADFWEHAYIGYFGWDFFEVCAVGAHKVGDGLNAGHPPAGALERVDGRVVAALVLVQGGQKKERAVARIKAQVSTVSSRWSASTS